MSSPNRNPPPDLWKRLALLRDRELCRPDWRRHFGVAFPAFAPFLEELPGTVAESYPDPETGLPLIPRRAVDGTFTAFSSDPDETRVGPVESIPAEDVTRHRVHWTELGRARQANNILRMLFEHWRDRRQTPLFKEVLLAGRKMDRLDIALSKHSHPRTWDLIRQQPDERTGKTRVWLRDDYTYEEQ